MNRTIKLLLLLAGLVPCGLYAQQMPTLTLEKAQELAQQNYPITRQRDLLRQTEQYTLDRLNKGYLPQLSVNGQATYQSDVTNVPLELPNMEIPSPPKEQYRITADVNQLVYDGGVIRQQKNVAQLSTAVETQQVEVELHKLRERINQLYLGTLLLDQQLEQVNLVQQDLEAGIRKVDAQVKNGVSFKSNLYLLQAELLKNTQRRTELQASRQATLQTLSLFLGQTLVESVTLAVPAETELAGKAEIQRPELKLYSTQRTLLEQQNKLILARNLPKTSLFGQSGYGNPGLNFLQNGADWWYMGGVRLNWSISNFYTYRNDKRILAVQQQLTEVQRETFLLNTNAQLKQQQAEIEKLAQLLETDREIAALRRKVKAAANAQLENGVITANDYLREVYAEDQARLTLILHQLQLLQAKITYSTLLGH
ncbi:TolC family protein [Pontibacter sp. E15-1]|uniref:TolC family protein n=1 Tax=Pontibacter sp. E15-1 TaxID=2919918 RepID=UPI001F4F6594|nr:TolC family protein [Pontibacter sp. E15-1]MCJ8163263.1 TolC family protein [Pontibacter sp. E15-1]